MSTDRITRRDWIDAALAVGVAAVTVAEALLSETGRSPLDYALLLTGALALAVRSRWPRVVLFVSLACGLGYTATAEPGAIALVPLLISLYTVVGIGHRVLGLAVATPLVVIAAATALSSPDATPATSAIEDAILPIGWFVAAFVLGEVTRHRNAYLRQAEQRAAEAERAREEEALRRAGEERLRIARELHDSLTHHISIIKLQAGVAVHLARKRGEDVPKELLAVQDASSEASRELRATLEVLRDLRAEETGNGLARLSELVDRSGVPTRLLVEGTPVELPAEVDRAAYRIVQEALTNIGRHADFAPAGVRVTYDADTVTVRVDDEGPASPAHPPVPGVGLIGMRERVTALGGWLRTEPRPEGGFTVEARLPVSVEERV